MSTTNRDWRPVYVQVADQLRDDILSGRLAPGEPLPSEADLADKYDLSRTSVRNSIRLLREWGLVRAEQGRGTYVRAQRQRVTRASERYQWEKDRALLSEAERKMTGATEHDTGLDLEDLEFRAEYKTVKATADLASLFDVRAGTKLLQRTYHTKSRQENAPLSLVTSYLVYDMISANPDLLDASNEPWPGGTSHQLRTVGIEIDHIIDCVTARPPLPDEAAELGVESGVALLGLRKTSIDTDGRTVEVSDVILPGDRTQLKYTVQLDRWPS